MEALIQDADFFHNDRKKRSDYNDKVRVWKNDNVEKIKGSQLLSALQVLNKKLTDGKCPTYDTEGWKQAMDIYNDLIWKVASQDPRHQPRRRHRHNTNSDRSPTRDLMDESTLNPHEMRTAFYNLYLEWFQYGPASVQLEIMRHTFFDSDINMEEYMKGLKGEQRKNLISAMMSPITKKEDTDDETFYTRHRYGMAHFIGNAFEKSSLVDSDTMKMWLDYSFHLYLDYVHLEDKALHCLIQEATNRFREIEGGWKDFADTKVIKSLIGKITKATKSPGFPRGEEASGIFSKPIQKLYTKLIKAGDAETYSDDVFDLLEAVSVCKGDQKEVMCVFKEVLQFFDKQKSDIIKKRVLFFKAVAPRFKDLLGKLDMNLLAESGYSSTIVDKLEKAYANNKTLVSEWLSLVVPLLKRPCYNTLSAVNLILNCNDQIRWKDHKEVAKEVFQCFTQVQLPTGESQKDKEYINKFRWCLHYLIRGLEKARLLKDFGEGLMFLGIHFLELKSHNDAMFELIEDIGEHIEINVKEHREKVMEVMKRIHFVLKDDSLPWGKSWPLQRAILDTIMSIIQPVNDGRIFTDDDLKVFTAMSITCLSGDALTPNSDCLAAHFAIGNRIMEKLLKWMAGTKRLGYAIKLIPLLLSKCEEDHEILSSISCRFLSDFARGEAATMTPYLDQLIKLYMEKEDVNILEPIQEVYPFNPAPMKDHFQAMLNQMLDSGEPLVKTNMTQIMWTASKKQPELFTEQNMKDIIETAKNDTGNQPMLMQIMSEVSKRKPERMKNHIDMLVDKKGWKPMMYATLNDMLSSLAINDKSQSNKIISHFVKSIKDNPHDKGVMYSALNSIRLTGFKYPDIIHPRREDIVSLPITDPDGQSLKKMVLDMIDGKTPDELIKQMEGQQAALGGLVDKVEDVEEAVIAVKDDLDKQGSQIENVQNEVSEQSQRLDQIEETVGDTVAKVEEIDSKTLSHAPYWSRDISKLLNPASDHDWRLLSSRLGYSNSDIRGWAQQADPCMAMLNEWYATRKTSEATYAILTNLQEMNRMDAALIVENAMKKAEAVVEDEEFEYASPPEIFISYQWGHQEEVKLLHRHLAMAGYDCWMDIGQMGGGDKLFEKIDNGMRAAKLVISCVTTKYAKSPNCNREVNLAVGVNKPIIPLLLEQCMWPPPGSMGPIFSESLYIRFFQTGQEQTKDDRFWSEDKFQELLMQLSVNGLIPDEGQIKKLYRNWWMPIQEEINIDKSKTRDGGKQVAVNHSDSNEEEQNPDVFISYQWGKQKNIIKLYQRLTSLGFSCWLDIKQMGGGDSLYDKIDRGIRGSKVVVTCVTKKYAISPNCRREVSLADALKKPMLPLLLENMTWPPSGPMSMIMTQLLYIGFETETAHTQWEGPQFDELVSKLNQHVPNALTNQPPEKKSVSNAEDEPKPQNPPQNKIYGTDRQPSFKPKPPHQDVKPPQDTESANGHPLARQPPTTHPSPTQPQPTTSSSAAPPLEPQNKPPKKSKSCSIL